MRGPEVRITLYTYFRSSAAFRVRIALALKGLKHQDVYVHLRKNEQMSRAFREVNPQGFVPALIHDGHTISQSLAIIEYLDEIFPDPPLLPSDPLSRARVRQIAYAVACDIHPINNLRVRRFLVREYTRTEVEVDNFMRHWIEQGFDALEEMIGGNPLTGRFCHGDQPTLADLCLIPQIANARAVNMDIERWPTLKAIEKVAYEIPAFVTAQPKSQADAE